MKGFGKFLLSIILVVAGILLMIGASGTLLVANRTNSIPLLVAVVIGLLCFLGGFYMLRHR